jgi:hypothetical protein
MQANEERDPSIFLRVIKLADGNDNGNPPHRLTNQMRQSLP